MNAYEEEKYQQDDIKYPRRRSGPEFYKMGVSGIS